MNPCFLDLQNIIIWESLIVKRAPEAREREREREREAAAIDKIIISQKRYFNRLHMLSMRLWSV